MDDISNRQIFIDTLVSILISVAVVVPLGVLLWWVSGLSPIPDRFRASVVGGLAGASSVVILGFIRRRRNAKGPNGQKRPPMSA